MPSPAALTLVENFRAVFYAPFYAAFALRAFEQEGLHVTLKPATDPLDAARFVVSGEGDVSWSGPLRLMSTLEQRPDSGAVAFCEVVGRDPFLLVGRGPNPSFQLEDLLGKKLATVSEVPTPWVCLRHDLRLAGIDEARLTVVAGASMAQNAAALRDGRVDVIQVFEPYAAQLEAEGAGAVWRAAAQRGPTSYTTFNTTRAFLAAQPETATRMCRALYRTLRWIVAHDGLALAREVAPYFPGLEAVVLARALERYRALGIWNRTPVLAREGLEWLRDAALAAGRLRTHFRYEDCVEMRHAERVAAEDPPSL
jgi:NitT/TauT family transport system substrate-binding protein